MSTTLASPLSATGLVNFTIRPACESDVRELMKMIRELAQFETLEHELEAHKNKSYHINIHEIQRDLADLRKKVGYLEEDIRKQKFLRTYHHPVWSQRVDDEK